MKLYNLVTVLALTRSSEGVSPVSHSSGNTTLGAGGSDVTDCQSKIVAFEAGADNTAYCTSRCSQYGALPDYGQTCKQVGLSDLTECVDYLESECLSTDVYNAGSTARTTVINACQDVITSQDGDKTNTATCQSLCSEYAKSIDPDCLYAAIGDLTECVLYRAPQCKKTAEPTLAVSTEDISYCMQQLIGTAGTKESTQVCQRQCVFIGQIPGLVERCQAESITDVTQCVALLEPSCTIREKFDVSELQTCKDNVAHAKGTADGLEYCQKSCERRQYGDATCQSKGITNLLDCVTTVEPSCVEASSVSAVIDTSAISDSDNAAIATCKASVVGTTGAADVDTYCQNRCRTYLGGHLSCTRKAITDVTECLVAVEPVCKKKISTADAAAAAIADTYETCTQSVQGATGNADADEYCIRRCSSYAESGHTLCTEKGVTGVTACLLTVEPACKRKSATSATASTASAASTSPTASTVASSAAASPTTSSAASTVSSSSSSTAAPVASATKDTPATCATSVQSTLGSTEGNEYCVHRCSSYSRGTDKCDEHFGTTDYDVTDCLIVMEPTCQKITA
eukprot:Blabericola_migrator_1__1586@NODE_141_length_13107_cov_85_385736_g123_i0_p2_GENE_NODE_141_length_13107_cov_85_385736_g123_i0NODE_141_length_13107_cov_85_385736_g123_i0_p2_ORF_typecomplete_len571_score91_58ATF7IP_BD/PF16788_5/19_NODE_141_length_13107_cov_85_385736_g123_i044926204